MNLVSLTSGELKMPLKLMTMNLLLFFDVYNIIKIVEIDESKFGKRKYHDYHHKGRRKDDWLVG